MTSVHKNVMNLLFSLNTQRFLSFNPSRRISAYDALSHPYFQSLDSTSKSLYAQPFPSKKPSLEERAAWKTFRHKLVFHNKTSSHAAFKNTPSQKILVHQVFPSPSLLPPNQMLPTNHSHRIRSCSSGLFWVHNTARDHLLAWTQVYVYRVLAAHHCHENGFNVGPNEDWGITYRTATTAKFRPVERNLLICNRFQFTLSPINTDLWGFLQFNTYFCFCCWLRTA